MDDELTRKVALSVLDSMNERGYVDWKGDDLSCVIIDGTYSLLDMAKAAIEAYDEYRRENKLYS